MQKGKNEVKPLCDACLLAAKNTPFGQGYCILMCDRCSISAAANYINNERKKNMENVKNKRALNTRITQCIENNADGSIHFPQVLTLCVGIGQPVFTITIEKSKEDYFIDDKGNKWVRAA